MEFHVAEAFGKLLSAESSDGGIHKSSLLEAVRKIKKNRQSQSDVLASYQQRLWRHLSGSVSGTVSSADFDLFHSKKESSWLTPFLHTWPNEILNTPSWNSIESPVPGVEDLPLQDTWVDVTLKELSPNDSVSLDELKNAASRELAFDRPWAGFSLRDLLGEIKDLTVVIGLPGAGKSTLIKWLVRHLIQDQDCPFTIPAVVSLRQYARIKESEPTISILEYFLRLRCPDPTFVTKWRGILAGLLDPPQES